jgi:hypothetical protein
MKWRVTILFLSVLYAFITISGCDNGIDTANTQTYQKVSFKRLGGGDKMFYTTLTSDLLSINFEVMRYDFKDTVYYFTVSVDDTLLGLYNAVDSTLKGKIDLKGGFVQPTSLTGTWAYLYVVDANGENIEITNEPIRNRLLLLERIVEIGRKN